MVAEMNGGDEKKAHLPQGRKSEPAVDLSRQDLAYCKSFSRAYDWLT